MVFHCIFKNWYHWWQFSNLKSKTFSINTSQPIDLEMKIIKLLLSLFLISVFFRFCCISDSRCCCSNRWCHFVNTCCHFCFHTIIIRLLNFFNIESTFCDISRKLFKISYKDNSCGYQKDFDSIFHKDISCKILCRL